jgi:hypothetical protein
MRYYIMTDRISIRTNEQKMNKTGSFRFIRSIKHSLLWAALGGVLLCTAPAPARADGVFLVVPPNIPTFGATYGEWSARWWQWFYMWPAQNGPKPHPSTWSGASKCDTGQLGPVWFLVGIPTSTGTTTTTIDCDIPAGKALFFPIITVECSNLEESPFYGKDAQARQQCAHTDISSVGNSLVATVDGHSINDLKTFEAQSPDFVFAVPVSNVVPLPPSSGDFAQSSADGYYLMLFLTPGKHTIHFGGTLSSFGFTVDTTYVLTVDM